MTVVRLGAAFMMAVLLPVSALAQVDSEAGYDAEAALAISQAAVGNPLADVSLTDSAGRSVRLSELGDKPVLISMIFTSCYHVCPAITRHLANAVEAARDALGEGSFRIVTVGFDTPNDSPQAMAAFARRLKIRDPDWLFLSGDAASMKQLTGNLGFVYFPSPRGFDHINQVTVVDRDGVIYRQVYGADFDLPWLVEPLKELVFDTPAADRHVFSGLADRVRLFCTVYDPTTGLYRFDYSLFVGMAVGALVLLVFGGWFVRETWRARRQGQG
ncbi:SCO family protein [Elongatibacter sediminis]|uniref:SCO family protein n=1 Tax=Elongatibacter sediminis TaxID=3119006 RepID=A0AAW9RHU4_9GAMM